jgi:hypothetical protein
MFYKVVCERQCVTKAGGGGGGGGGGGRDGYRIKNKNPTQRMWGKNPRTTLHIRTCNGVRNHAWNDETTATFGHLVKMHEGA